MALCVVLVTGAADISNSRGIGEAAARQGNLQRTAADDCYRR